MKKAIRSSIIAGCLGIVFSMVGVAETRAQVLRQIEDRMEAYNQNLQSLQASVTMEKFDSTLKIPETYSGSVSYIAKAKGHDRYARIDWTKPAQESLVVIGSDYELYRPRLNQVIYGKTSGGQGKAGNLLSFLTMSRAELKANFDVSYIGEEQISGGTNTWHLQLKPLKTTDYKMADIWVDSDGTPRQARVLEKNNDTTTLMISGIKKNPTIKGDAFKLNYPSNVTKVKG